MRHVAFLLFLLSGVAFGGASWATFMAAKPELGVPYAVGAVGMVVGAFFVRHELREIERLDRS